MIDLLIGMAISLLALLAIERAVSIGLNSKRVISEVLDADMAANMAIAQLESEIKTAGYGISMMPYLMCELSYWSTVSPNPDPIVLNPLLIESSGTSSSDTITIMRAKGDTGFAGSITDTLDTTGKTINILHRYNFKNNDHVIVSDWNGISTTAACSRIILKSDPATTSLISYVATDNPTPATVPVLSVGSANYTADLGQQGISVRTYSVDSAKSALNRIDITQDNISKPVAEQIVYLKAFYGKAADNGMRVTLWDQTAPATPAEWTLVRAIRIAIVAKSNAYEQTLVAPASLPLWSSENPTGALNIAAQSYSISAENQHYRHVSRDMIIPLKNLIWNNN